MSCTFLGVGHFSRVVSILSRLCTFDPGQKRKQLWNVIYSLVCAEVINEMIILAITKYLFEVGPSLQN